MESELTPIGKPQGESSLVKKTSENGELSDQYIITPKDFVDQGYGQRIQNQNIDVYYVNPDLAHQPGPDASPFEKKAWEYMMTHHSNADKIIRIEPTDDPSYYFAYNDSGSAKLGLNKDAQLVVVPRRELKPFRSAETFPSSIPDLPSGQPEKKGLFEGALQALRRFRRRG